MAETYRQFRKMRLKDLIDGHDKVAKPYERTTSEYLQEIARRDQNRQTRWIIAMTVIMTIATVINVYLAACHSN